MTQMLYWAGAVFVLVLAGVLLAYAALSRLLTSPSEDEKQNVDGGDTAEMSDVDPLAAPDTFEDA